MLQHDRCFLFMRTRRIAALALIALILSVIVVYPHQKDVSFTQENMNQKGSTMFLGLRTVIYHVEDIASAKKWYAEALGVQPYFDQPFYVGFNVGGFELGLDPDLTGVSKGNNLVAYWGAENIEDTLARLLELGAKKNSGTQDVGGHIRLATVIDPFGNVLGIIENPQFKIE